MYSALLFKLTKYFRYLDSKKTEYLVNIALFSAGYVCLSQGFNEQTKFLAYFSSFFFYLLARKLKIWESFVVGFVMGAWFGYVSFHWLSFFKDFTAFNLAIAFNGLLFSLIFGGASFLFNKYPKNTFVHIFSFSLVIFLIRAVFHYSPFMAYAKAFLTLVNTSTYFDWLVPVFGSSITDILVLATGCLMALIYTHLKDKKSLNNLYPYIFVFLLLALVPLFSNYGQSFDKSKKEIVKVALLQGNFNWDWEDRVRRTEEIVEYYSKETANAAGQGAQIVIWPEYAVAKDILHSNQILSEKLVSLSYKHKVVIVAGSLELITDQPNPNNKWTGYDVSLVFDPEKILLEPYRAIYPISDNVLVGKKRIIFDTKYGSFPVISCFEVAYHKFVADYSNQSQPVDFLVGIANIQLFLGTDGTKRIQDHIRRIAMENGKYFVYVSNTGPSFVINPKGEFEHIVPTLAQKTLVVDVPKIKERSFYSKYQDLPLLLLFSFSYGTVLYTHSKRKKR